MMIYPACSQFNRDIRAELVECESDVDRAARLARQDVWEDPWADPYELDCYELEWPWQR